MRRPLDSSFNRSEEFIPETIEDPKAFGLRMIVPGHCTGWLAVHALADQKLLKPRHKREPSIVIRP